MFLCWCLQSRRGDETHANKTQQQKQQQQQEEVTVAKGQTPASTSSCCGSMWTRMNFAWREQQRWSSCCCEPSHGETSHDHNDHSTYTLFLYSLHQSDYDNNYNVTAIAYSTMRPWKSPWKLIAFAPSKPLALLCFAA